MKKLLSIRQYLILNLMPVPSSPATQMIKMAKVAGTILTFTLTSICCCARNTSVRTLCQLSQHHHTSHTHLVYLSTFQPPTSKAPSALCPRCTSRYVPPVMQKKSQCASVNVCLCSCLFSVCFTVVHQHLSTASLRQHICEPLQCIPYKPHPLLSVFLCLSPAFFAFLTLNPCSTNYS